MPLQTQAAADAAIPEINDALLSVQSDRLADAMYCYLIGLCSSSELLDRLGDFYHHGGTAQMEEAIYQEQSRRLVQYLADQLRASFAKLSASVAQSRAA